MLPPRDEDEDDVIAVDDLDNLPWDETTEDFEEVDVFRDEDDILRNWC